MPAYALPPPILIADAAGLTALVPELEREPVVAVDTESNSLHAYRERVCLIQFSTPARDYIVDPLRLPDLSPLAPLFANAQQPKVFHAAEYDLLCLKRDYGFAVAEIFDTMFAARTLGWTQLGLAAILEARFDVKMNKRYQRADWGRRPLTPEQLDYARLDTHHLLPLRDMLLAELTAAGRLDEAREDFDRIAQVKNGPTGNGAPAFWRVKGARDLTPAQAGVLQALWRYREQQAERADRPPFKIMGNTTLIGIARAGPRRLDDLGKISGMTSGQIQRHGAALLEAVRRGLSGPPLHPPRPAREADIVLERYDLLHKWRKAKGKARGVESDVILPPDALWELARSAPRTVDDLGAVEHLGPWRRATYGPEIIRLLDGK